MKKRNFLHYAVMNGDYEEVQRIVTRTHGKHINKLYKHQTPLHLAVELRHVNIVKYLLNNGANPLIRDTIQGQSVLHTACLLIYVSSLRLAFDPLERYLICNYVYGPLLENVEENSVTIAGLLLEKAPELLIIPDHQNNTPLHIAAISNHVQMISYLVSQGADIECKDGQGKTPLLFASIGLRINAIKTLLEHGAHVNALDIFSSTALHYVLCYGPCKDIVEVLLQNGANVNHRSDHNITPLHQAVLYMSKETDVVELLIEYGADIHAVDYAGDTALHTAIWTNVNVAQVLLEHGASISARNYKQQTPIYSAILYPRDNNILLLLRYGADLNVLDINRNTPLTQYLALSKDFGDLVIKDIVTIVAHFMLVRFYCTKKIKNKIAFIQNSSLIESTTRAKNIALLCAMELADLTKTKIGLNHSADLLIRSGNMLQLFRMIKNVKLYEVTQRCIIYRNCLSARLLCIQYWGIALYKIYYSLITVYPFTRLPSDIMVYILGHLSYEELVSMIP